MNISKINPISHDIRMKSAIKGAACAMVLGTGVLFSTGAFSDKKPQPVVDNNKVEKYDASYLKEAKSISELINRMNVIRAYNEEHKQETFWDKKIKEAHEEHLKK